jgi:hypothetical protein
VALDSTWNGLLNLSSYSCSCCFMSVSLPLQVSRGRQASPQAGAAPLCTCRLCNDQGGARSSLSIYHYIPALSISPIGCTGSAASRCMPAGQAVT